MRKFLIGAAAALVATAAHAEIVVTEIWAGGIPGAEATADWFELTNYGAAAVDPNGWFYDDGSNDPTENTALAGLNMIQPGESVVLLASWDDDFLTPADAVTAFENVWSVGDSLDGVQIGWIDGGGGGLGSSSDEVYIYDSNLPGANVIATQLYVGPTDLASFVTSPDGTWNNDFAQEGVWGAYASALPASDEPGIGSAIGSPGLVPEPASLMLLSLGALGLIRRR